MRKRNLYCVDDKVSIRRFVARGAGVHVRYDGENIGYIERYRVWDKLYEKHVVVFIPVSNGKGHAAPMLNLRLAVENVVRRHEIDKKGHTVWTARKDSSVSTPSKAMRLSA